MATQKDIGDTFDRLSPMAMQLRVSKLEAESEPRQLAPADTIFVYYQLFCLCIVANFGPAGLLLFQNTGQQYRDWNGVAGIAISANFCFGILIQTQYFIDLCFQLASILPMSTCLCFRPQTSVHRYIGIGDGCWVAGSIWYSIFGTTLRLDRGGYDTEIIITLSTTILLLLLMAILAIAHPHAQSIWDNQHDSIHQFLGWTLIIVLWLQVVLISVMNTSGEDYELGLRLLRAPSLWILAFTTTVLVYPWVIRRMQAVQSERPSYLLPHVGSEPSWRSVRRVCRTVRLAISVLEDWQVSAIVSEGIGYSYHSFASHASDWCGSLSYKPALSIWSSERAAFEVPKATCLFKRTLSVTTKTRIESSVLAQA